MLRHTSFSFVTGGKSSKIFVFDLWPWEIKAHFEVMSQKCFNCGKIIYYLAFGTNRTPLSWWEPRLCPFEDKMLSQVPWPRVTSISDLRGHQLLKVGVWGGLTWCDICAKFEPNRRGSVSEWPKSDRTWRGMTHLRKTVGGHYAAWTEWDGSRSETKADASMLGMPLFLMSWYIL